MSDFISSVLTIEPATMQHYDALSEYHYRTDKIKPATNIYRVKAKGRHHKSFPDPVAVVVYRMPIPCIKARNYATFNYFNGQMSLSNRLKLVNKYIRYLARVIVHPSFRKLGIATWLIRDTLEKQDVSIIETLTPIDFTNRMFQNTGFILHKTPPAPWYQQIKDVFRKLGLTEQSLEVPIVVHERINALTCGDFKTVDQLISRFVHHFRHRENMPHTLERTKFVLEKLYCPSAYLIWNNPKIALPAQKPGKQHYSASKEDSKPAIPA